MSGSRSTAALLVWLVLCQCSSAQESATRQVIVKLVDEQNAPIADGQVVATVTSLGQRGERMGDIALTDRSPSAMPLVIASATGADGRAILEFTPTNDAMRHCALRINLWKAGYAMRTVSIVREATIQLYRPYARPIRVLDSQGQPIANASIEIAAPEALAAREDWKVECAAKTDDLGMATLPCHSRELSILIRDNHGGKYYGHYLSPAIAGAGVYRQPYDLLIFNLPEVGRIEGRIPAGLSDEYRPRVLMDDRGRVWEADSVHVAMETKLSDGVFELSNARPGNGWCSVQRRLPYKVDEQLPTQLIAPAAVHVVAGETAQVELAWRPAAVVHGKVECESAKADLSTVQVSLMGYNDDPSQPQGHGASALCDAQGNYRLPLLPGKYRISLPPLIEQEMADTRWIQADIVEFEVGQGAATVTAPPLKISRVTKIPVAIKGLPKDRIVGEDEPRMMLNLLMADRSFGDGELAVDGLGLITIREGGTVQEYRLAGDNTSRLYSRMVDTDASEAIELDFDTQSKGQTSNVSIETRVVNPQGQPLGGIPVRLSLSFEPASNSTRWAFPIQQRIVANLTSQSDGSVRLMPSQIFRTFTLPNELANTELKITFGVMAASGNGQPDSQLVVNSTLTQWNQPQVTIPDLVLPQPPVAGTLKGRLLDSQSRPLASQVVWLSQEARVCRAISNAQGEFQFQQVTTPAWLLTEVGWTVQQVTDLAQVVQLQPRVADAVADVAGQPESRLPLEERRQLAKSLIDNMSKLPAVKPLVSMPAAAFLEPEKYYQQLLVTPGADQLRLQFVSFWNRLEDAKLQRLAEVMQSGDAKAQVLWILARRHPSQAAYEQVMEAIPLPGQEDQRLPLMPILGTEYRGQDALISKVAIELYRFGALEPYRDKLQQFMAKVQEQRDKISEGREMPMPTTLILCRALLDPQGFAEQVVANLQISEREINPQERVGMAASATMLLRLAPKSITQLPVSRLAFTDESMFEQGRLAARETLDALKNVPLHPDMLRWLVLGAMLQQDPEARQIFQEMHPRLTAESRLGSASFRMNSRNPELPWVRAAEGISPDLARQAAWQLALEYLRTGHDEASNSILSANPRREAQNLEIAFAIRNYFPELTREIVASEIPAYVQQIESEARRPFIRVFDLSVASFLAPEQLARMWEKLDEQLIAEFQNAAGNRQPFSRLNGINAMKTSYLKGLLAEDLDGQEF